MQPFHQGFHLPPAIGYPTGGEWAPSSLPAVIANVGTTDCSTFAGFHNWYRDQNNHVVGLGARGPGEPGYRGDAFIVEGVGHAEFARWSPNEVVVRVTGARKGDHVALDQNYDPGWLVNGRPALAVSDVPAATLQSSDETVVFRYRPKTLWLGLAIVFSAFRSWSEQPGPTRRVGSSGEHFARDSQNGLLDGCVRRQAHRKAQSAELVRRDSRMRKRHPAIPAQLGLYAWAAIAPLTGGVGGSNLCAKTETRSRFTSCVSAARSSTVRFTT